MRLLSTIAMLDVAVLLLLSQFFSCADANGDVHVDDSNSAGCYDVNLFAGTIAACAAAVASSAPIVIATITSTASVGGTILDDDAS